ncbi:tetratricopeptide repeat protein [Pedobacter sp. MW01-1-1]|uniref:tetratricopeptide repeat protein n=1 Tax=Pedobacter sp. MW01-1-1 TaxID=3383027 RepID=UPI003FEF4E11
MQKRFKLLTIFTLVSFNLFAQKSQILIGRNSVAKLQAAIGEKQDGKKQLAIITEGLKAISAAETDWKTKNWVETWSIKSYLSSYAALVETDETSADKYFDMATEAIKKAKNLDKYEDNAGLIKASEYNIIIKKQDKGNAAFFNNDFKEAFENLKDVSSNFPKDTTLALNTGICALNIQQYDDALKYFNQAKDNGIRNPSVYQKIAQLYSAKFDTETAQKVLEAGLVVNPYNRNLTNDYINLLIETDNYSKAQSLIETNLKVEKSNKLLFFLYGYIQQQNGNNDTAILAFDRALDLDQNYFDALYQLSLAYITNANDVLKKNDADKTAKYDALISKAQATLSRANEINPNDKKTTQLLIDIYSYKNDEEKVQELKRKLRDF